MKKLRSHTKFILLLSGTLSLGMIIPAQAVMLWCTMDMSEMQMNEEMNMHSGSETMQQDSMTHCDGTTSDLDMETNSESEDHCTFSVDCNCTITQQTDDQATSVLSAPTTLNIQITESVIDKVLVATDSKETFPPPLWSSSSYSPPSLFLANASFLI